MNEQTAKADFWRPAFLSLLVFYCLFYAPYGINETDGGFLTGLAWQVLSGKTLYADVVYVRPPMPVWLRSLELLILPENWAELGERWIFYGKVALYSWLGAAVLIREPKTGRWMVATLGFVLSAHCYPAASWHTVDGILFSTLAIWFWTNFSNRWTAVLSGISIICAVLCKQSFYPMLPVWLVVFLAFSWQSQPVRVAIALGAALSAFLLFLLYLNAHQLLHAYWSLTSGATSEGAAIQYGLRAYFDINPKLLLGGLGLLLLAAGSIWLKRGFKPAFWLWTFCLVLLAGSYAWTIWQRREFTVPFAQTRLLFMLAAGFGLYNIWKKQWPAVQNLRYFGLLALSWCAAISWGYNLPILFALPWLYAVVEISTALFRAAYPGRRPSWLPVGVLLALLLLFRLGYAFVYRDGPRAAMTGHLGNVFPRLSGIYSSPETLARYRNLQELAARYGPVFKTLPTFPAANFLTDTRPPLPLDWVVEREMGQGKVLVQTAIQENRLVYFIETDQLYRIGKEPEYALTKTVLQKGRVIEKTDWFWVVVY